MGVRRYRIPNYKFFSFTRFLEAYRVSLVKAAKSTTSTVKTYYDKLYNLVSEFEEVVLDESGVILSWNPKVKLLEGYTEEEILGQNLNLFLPPAARQQGIGEQLIAKARDNGTATHYGELVRKDGSLFVGSIKIVRIKSPSGILGFVASCKKAGRMTAKNG